MPVVPTSSDREVDWEGAVAELAYLLDRYRSGGSNWDCIVPVSGGKDSTYQVVRMLQLGLNPLCVTSTTCDLSAIGRENIENLKRWASTTSSSRPIPIVRAKLNRIGLTQVGDISWPEHVGIFTIPVRAAVQFNVPLIVWGENSQNEYGGPAAAAQDNVLTRRWLEEFGGLLGMRVSDLSVPHTASCDTHLLPYQYPSDEELSAGWRYRALPGLLPALGRPVQRADCAGQRLSHLDHVVEGSMVNYENLDNHQTGIHDYFKYPEVRLLARH